MVRWEYLTLTDDRYKNHMNATSEGLSESVYVDCPDGRQVIRWTSKWIELGTAGSGWQHQYFDSAGLPTGESCTFLSLMNELGGDGWEFVSERAMSSTYRSPYPSGMLVAKMVFRTATFKREKRD